MAAIRKKVEKLNQNREQGTLHHHQCIDELTSRLRNVSSDKTSNAEESKIVSPTRSETPTSFVTVIEVKDPSPTQTSVLTSQASTSIAIANEGLEIVRKDSTSSSPDLHHRDSKYGSRSSMDKTFDESQPPTIQNSEIKRKIPPRYFF